MAADDSERKTVRARAPAWRGTGEMPALPSADARPTVLHVRQLLAGGSVVESFESFATIPPVAPPAPRPCGVFESWQEEKVTFFGWEDETRSPRWEEYAAQAPSHDMADLLMPKTVIAIARSQAWLRSDRMAGGWDDGEDGAALATLVEARRIKDVATRKLATALERVLGEAERAAPPAAERELERVDRLLVGLVARIDRWFEPSAQRDANRSRTRALRARWSQALAKQRQESLAVYRKLAAVADAEWPAIEGAIDFKSDFATDFAPSELAAWRGRTIKLGRVYNRAGWDFAGPYRFAVRVKGVPIVGNYSPEVTAALNEAQRRIGRPPNEHTPWDVIAVVEGEGSVNQRNETHITGKGKAEKVTLVTWDPAACVTIRIIALHAGPIAVGPR